MSGAQPGGKHKPVLRPREYPRNSAQTLDSSASPPPRRPRSERQTRQLLLRCSVAEVGNKVGMIAHYSSIGSAGTFGHDAHTVAPGLPRVTPTDQIRTTDCGSILKSGYARQWMSGRAWRESSHPAP